MPTSAPARTDDTRVFITDVAGAGNGRSNSLPGRTRSLGGSPWPFIKLSPSPFPRSDFPFHPEGGTSRPPGRDEKVPSEACHLRRGERRNPRVRWPLPREARAVDHPRAGRGMQGARSTRRGRPVAGASGIVAMLSSSPKGRQGHPGAPAASILRRPRPAAPPSCLWPVPPAAPLAPPTGRGALTARPRFLPPLRPVLRCTAASSRLCVPCGPQREAVFQPLAAGRAPFLAPYVRYAAAPLICPS